MNVNLDALAMDVGVSFISSPFYGDVSFFLERFSDCKVYLWGGAVRDSLLKSLYGLDVVTRDFDFIVDDSGGPIDFAARLFGLDNVSLSRFGTPKWRRGNGLEVDISPFSLIPVERGLNVSPLTIDEKLGYCDVTTSASAFDLRIGELYAGHAVDALLAREVDILFETDAPEALVSKVLVHADTFGFSVGPRTHDFVMRHADRSWYGGVKRHLGYKGKSDKVELVMSGIDRLLRS